MNLESAFRYPISVAAVAILVGDAAAAAPPALQEGSRCGPLVPVPVRGAIGDLDGAGRLRLDRRPVPAKSDILAAWKKRQDVVRSLQFSWTEEECYPRGWLPNPRYAERERLAIPGLMADRSFTINKSLSVSGATLRYSFELDRPVEPDGVVVASPGGRSDGLAVGRHYSYVSVFDGERGESRVTSFAGQPPPAAHAFREAIDAQNLDTRAILLTFRPLDRIMGSVFLDRAVTNQARAFYRDRSTFLLEEQHDPSGWKTILWIEPEREFVVGRLALMFEQRWMVDMDIEYEPDAHWGWVPRSWRVTAMLADGTRRQISAARVTAYEINGSR